MAQPTNTMDSYDQNGIREDLADVIYDVSPEDTPFFSACAKTGASNTYHEWQTDALRASAANAHIEGDASTATARTATARVGNYTQIFKDTVITTGTDKNLKKAGRGKEMAYQIMKAGKEQKLDIEKALFDNNARVAGSGTTARELAGAPAWLATNITNTGVGGADPTGDGTDARTDGTPTAFTQADFDLCMQNIWENGGRPDTVYLSAYQMNIALGFTGMNNQRSTVTATRRNNMIVKDFDLYVTPWGNVTFIPSRENRSRDVFIMQSDMWKVAQLRPMMNEGLAKDGDYEKRHVITELTLVSANEKASGAVVDCSTS